MTKRRWSRHGRFAVEQLHAEFGFELPERLTDGLLGSAQVGCGSRESSVIDDGEKVA